MFAALACVVLAGCGVSSDSSSPTSGSSSPSAIAGACAVSPPSNGTGYSPPSNTASLPTEIPRPGPDILYRPLTNAPQLENTGVWKAAPIMISGASAYRNGEFVYQDFLYDDTALIYPAEPDKYAENSADFVEIRLRPLANSLAIRITYNSMYDPEVTATTIGLGDSSEARAMPHNAGAVMPAEVFVTVHGCAGSIVNASDGSALPMNPTVVTDLPRRQVHVEIPYSAFDPRGKTALRVGAAAGLWDVTAGQYQRPDAAKPAFFNVAFHGYGPWTQSTWMDVGQNAALTAGDLSPMYTTVDFTKLAAGVNDDMPDQPGGVPQTGPMNRILVSHFEPRQGRGGSGLPSVPYDLQDADTTPTRSADRCEPPSCTHQYSGRLQPYSVYVPAMAPPQDGYGLVINMHGSGGNQNHFEGGGPEPPLVTWQMLAEAGRPSIMAMPNARGKSYWYGGLSAVDVFEMWADVAARYKLDPRYAIVSGSSMGGFGSYKFGLEYPDLFNLILPNVAATSATGITTPSDPNFLDMFASARNVPVLATQSSDSDPASPASNTAVHMAKLDQLGYRYDHWFFSGGHSEYRYYVYDRYQALSLGFLPNDRNPRRVTYVVNPELAEPADYGMNADHAYWVSGVTVRDPATSTLGTVDVISSGFPVGDAVAGPVAISTGTNMNGSGDFERFTREWGDAPEASTADALSISATNVR